MPSQKAVCVRVTSVTQPNTTFLAPPRTVNAFLCGFTSFTPASLVPVWVTVTLHLDGEGQGTKKTSTMAWAAPRAVVTNELFVQIYSGLLDVGDSILGVLAEKNVWRHRTESRKYTCKTSDSSSGIDNTPAFDLPCQHPPYVCYIGLQPRETLLQLEIHLSLCAAQFQLLVDCIQLTWPSQLSCPSMRMHRHCRTEE